MKGVLSSAKADPQIGGKKVDLSKVKLLVKNKSNKQKENVKERKTNSIKSKDARCVRIVVLLTD